MKMVKAGRISSDVVMKMMLGFKAEDSYVVWNIMNSCFGLFGVILYDHDCYGDYKKWVSELMSLIVDSIGWEAQEGKKCQIDINLDRNVF